jgi:glutaredoxin/glutathione-dependent peroxiredoxin
MNRLSVILTAGFLLSERSQEPFMIQPGAALPDVTLYEFIDEPTDGCALGPNPVSVTKAAQGKTIALFGLPGAFTPTCSERHAPAYIEQAEAFKAAGVDEIWCVAVNDAFVMGAWARSLGAGRKVRFLADGSADFAKATGLTLDLSAKGLGLRSGRFSMLVKNGVVTHLNNEQGGGLAVSDAATLLAQAQG